MHETNHLFTNMLSYFESLYAHTIEHIQDKDHNNITHVHNQGQHYHKVILTFHVQYSISSTYKTLTNNPILCVQVECSCEAP